MKKIIASIIVIGLLLTTSMVTVNAKTCRPNKTIYVDDDNTQGPWDGTIEHPYQNIIDAIDVASSGDTVFVFNGTYTSSNPIAVRKSINLIGEDPDSTIIDLGFEIEYADYVTVSGFTAKNWGIRFWHSSHGIIRENILLEQGGIQLSNCSNCVVSDNFISPFLDNGITITGDSISTIISNNYISGANERGIHIFKSNDTLITDNYIINSGQDGINVHGAESIIISDNTIINNDQGINLWPVSNSSVIGNTITNNHNGINIANSESLTISNNVASNNDQNGIDVGTSENIAISHNTLMNNHIHGIALSNSDDIVISDNNISNNFACGIFVCFSNNNDIVDNIVKNNADGINLYEAHENTIDGNEIKDNYYRGVVIEGRIFSNTVSKNIIENNNYGLELKGFIDPNAKPGFKSRIPINNKIVANNIENNVEYGIYSNYLTLDNFIYYNNFINNDQNARDVGTNTWYKMKLTGSLGNYWDDFEDNQGYPNYYYVPPLVIRNNDLYPNPDPFDIENIDVSSYEVIKVMTVEESEYLAQIEEMINSQILSGELNLNNIMNAYALLVTTPNSNPTNR